MARCPLYRLLLAGPGDDAEGVDAGELAYYAAATGGVTGSWDALHRAGIAPAGQRDRPRRRWHGPGGTRAGPEPAVAGGGARAGRTGAAASAGRRPACWPASRPRLSCSPQVDALPPANDEPDVDGGSARAADPHFSLRRLLRPFALALIVGLVLDGLDALASLAMPALVRDGIDNGVETQAVPRVIVVSVGGPRDRAGRLGHQRGADRGGRPQRRAAALHAAGQDLLAPAAARPRLLRAGDCPAGS